MSNRKALVSTLYGNSRVATGGVSSLFYAVLTEYMPRPKII